MRSRASQCGSVTLLVAVTILPLLFLGLALSVDMANYYGDTRAVQSALDDAAMHAYRFLPYQADAERAATSYLATRYPQYFENGQNVEMRVTGDAIALRYVGRSPLVFPRLFGLLTQSDVPEDISIAATGVARGTAMDVFIALDASAQYMAPPLAGPAWESDTDWPAAGFFQNLHTFIGADGQPIDARVATQQCWNPALGMVKRAALRTYQYFSAFNRDQVGVGVFPGYGAYVDVLRDVLPLDVPVESGAEAKWVDFYGEARGDAYCAGAAEREVNEAKYRLPSNMENLPTWTPPSGAPAQMVVPPTWNFDPDYASYLRVSQAIWSAASRDGGMPEFASLLQYSASMLLGAPILETRTSLKMQTMKIGFIFAGDLPWVAGTRWTPGGPSEPALRQSLQNLRSFVEQDLESLDMRLQYYYVLFDHPGNGGVGALVDELQAVFDDELGTEESSRVKVDVVFAQSAERFGREMLPPLLLTKRNVMVSQ